MKPDGLSCLDCGCTRLFVVGWAKKVVGRSWRYLECSACGCRVLSEETILRKVTPRTKPHKPRRSGAFSTCKKQPSTHATPPAE